MVSRVVNDHRFCYPRPGKSEDVDAFAVDLGLSNKCVAGHYITLEQPQSIAEAIGTFIRENSLRIHNLS